MVSLRPPREYCASSPPLKPYSFSTFGLAASIPAGSLTSFAPTAFCHPAKEGGSSGWAAKASEQNSATSNSERKNCIKPILSLTWLDKLGAGKDSAAYGKIIAK